MGDISQYKWIEKNKDLINPSVLEIGSKFYSEETFMNYRDLCENQDYFGIDMSEGKNVDKVVDFTSNFENIYNSLGNHFNTVICCSVLEHVRDIFTFSENVTSILNPKGILFLSVPFTWEYHGYPSDYWRFTPNAIEYLFNSFDFPSDLRTISSHQVGDTDKLDENPNDFAYHQLMGGKVEANTNLSISEILRSIYQIIKNKRVYNQKIIYNSIKTTRYLKPACINMVGIKK